MRPPRQAPHVGRRIRSAWLADAHPSEMGEHVQAEVPDRDRRVQDERCDRLVAPRLEPVASDVERPDGTGCGGWLSRHCAS